MTVVLVLPRLVGARQAVRRMVDAVGPVVGREVVVECRENRSAPPSFADELVLAVLVEGRATSLEVRDASTQFAGYVLDAFHARAGQVGPGGGVHFRNTVPGA